METINKERCNFHFVLRSFFFLRWLSHFDWSERLIIMLNDHEAVCDTRVRVKMSKRKTIWTICSVSPLKCKYTRLNSNTDLGQNTKNCIRHTISQRELDTNAIFTGFMHTHTRTRTQFVCVNIIVIVSHWSETMLLSAVVRESEEKSHGDKTVAIARSKA